MTHAEKGKELFLSGYNCSQSVLGAFCQELGMDFDTAMKLSSSFGAGMGRMREVCGAVSGMFMVAGLKEGFVNPTDEDAAKKKTEHYQRIQDLAKAYIEQSGSIICRQLLGLEEKRSSLPMFEAKPEARTAEYYKKRPCADLVAMACQILDDQLFNQSAHD